MAGELLNFQDVTATLTRAVKLVDSMAEGSWDGALCQSRLRRLQEAADAVIKDCEVQRVRSAIASAEAHICNTQETIAKHKRTLEQMGVDP